MPNGNPTHAAKVKSSGSKITRKQELMRLYGDLVEKKKKKTGGKKP